MLLLVLLLVLNALVQVIASAGPRLKALKLKPTEVMLSVSSSGVRVSE